VDFVVAINMQSSALAAYPLDIALAYAWGKVCFSTWDSCLESVARLCAWDAWPPALRQLFHALYPAYFVYASAKRLAGPEGPANRSDVPKFVSVLMAAAIAVAIKGARDGAAARRRGQ